jgi:hypothetical protein
MGKNIIYGICLLFLMNTSCSLKKDQSVFENKIADIRWDSIIIEISGHEMPTYYNFSSLLSKITSEYPVFVGYNNYEHSFDYFDLSAQKLIKKVNLEYEGPNGIRKLGNFSFINHDSILIFESMYFYKIDVEGIVYLRKKNSDLEKGRDFQFINEISMQFPENNLCYANGRIYSHVVPLKAQFWEKEFYDKPFIASISLESNYVDFLNIKYPYEANPDRLFGYLLKPYILKKGNDLIYNFPFSSKIYKYDLRKNSFSVFDGKSQFTKNESEPLDFNLFKGKLASHEIGKHFINSLHFHKMVYDSHKRLFYRVHTKKVETPGNDKKPLTLKYLCIFDKDLNKIAETELDNKLFTNNYIPSKNGIIFQVANYDNIKDINKLKFKILKFDVKTDKSKK